MTTLKNPIFIGFFAIFPFLFFFFFLFLFSNIKKKKTKNAIFFSKTSFLTTQNFAKTLFWHTVTLFVLQKKPKKHYKTGENSKKNLDQFLTYNLDQFLTYKTPNLGPVFNFTAYIYIYIYLSATHYLATFCVATTRALVYPETWKWLCLVGSPKPMQSLR